MRILRFAQDDYALYRDDCDSFCETAAPVKPQRGLP
jgi:hypothetical protein